jgi:putative tryptophan/tyrosine transport system substrate-binding protein
LITDPFRCSYFLALIVQFRGVGNEATPFHIGARVRRGRVAARGARAAGGDAGDRLLGSASSLRSRDLVAAFQRGLQTSGYNEGQNVHIEYRWAEGKQEQMPALTADLVRRRVSVIVAAGGTAARAAKAATTVIPIIFWLEGDPVEIGLVSSLHRPGGNLTGVTTMGADLVLKRLELMHEVTSSDTIAVLIDPTTLTSEMLIRDLRATAQSMSIQLHVLRASNEVEIESAFATLDKLQARGLVIGPGPFLLSRSEQLAALAYQGRPPGSAGEAAKV